MSSLVCLSVNVFLRTKTLLILINSALIPGECHTCYCSEVFSTIILIVLLHLLLLVFKVTVFKSICSVAYLNHVLVDNASAVLPCIRFKRINTYLLTYLSIRKDSDRDKIYGCHDPFVNGP